MTIARDREDEDRHRDAQDVPRTEEQQMLARPVVRKRPRLARPESDAVDNEARGKCYEQRRRLDERDHDAVDDTDRDRDRQGDESGRPKEGTPCWMSISATHQEPAMMATSLRSMPRLMTISPMPRPRMPEN